MSSDTLILPHARGSCGKILFQQIGGTSLKISRHASTRTSVDIYACQFLGSKLTEPITNCLNQEMFGSSIFNIVMVLISSRGAFLRSAGVVGVTTSSIFAGMGVASAMSTSASSASSSKYDGALIFLHGLGDTPYGWSEIQYLLPEMKPRLDSIKYVFPPAPKMPITINGGMIMTGWFDLYDWPIDIGCQDDREGLLRAVEQIEGCVQKLSEEDNIPPSKIVIGGFSQGGAAALLAAYLKNKNQYAGCVGLSAWLTLVDDLQKKADSGGDGGSTSKTTPLFWGHGTSDEVVLFQQQSYGINKLKELGVSNIHQAHYNMGHSSDPDELKAMAEFIDKCLFENANGQEEL